MTPDPGDRPNTRAEREAALAALLAARALHACDDVAYALYEPRSAEEAQQQRDMLVCAVADMLVAFGADAQRVIDQILANIAREHTAPARKDDLT